MFNDNYYVNPDTIENEYHFQKAYIEEYAKNYASVDETDDLHEYDKQNLEEGKADALKNLYDNFNLNYQIEEEYDDYMYKVAGKKYNL